jgi:hypothetical protein
MRTKKSETVDDFATASAPKPNKYPQSSTGRGKPSTGKQLKTDLLSHFTGAVWGASCRTTSFIFRFNRLDYGPLGFLGSPKWRHLEVRLKIQMDLRA